MKKGAIAAAITAGFALLSDGYQANTMAQVTTMFARLYPDEYDTQKKTIIASSLFAGIIVGQLAFGYAVDRIGRRWGMILSSVIVIVGALLCASAYGAGGSIHGMFAALAVYRVVLGVGIGSEYPCGSVGSSEASEQAKRGYRHLLFVATTNFVINLGFVLGAFVPLVLLWIFGEGHLELNWRLTFGLGIVPPLIVFIPRIYMHEGERFEKCAIVKTPMPYRLIVRYYWRNWLKISLIWAIYNFASYSFGIYSSTIVSQIVPIDPVTGLPNLYKVFGWTVLINAFYLPGSVSGALAVDKLGPRGTLIVGLSLQVITGFFLAGFYNQISRIIPLFVVLYGLFLSFGEFGPGDNIGLLASKTPATCIRGQFYGTAAACGKVGAYLGSWIFPLLAKVSSDGGAKVNVFVASGMACGSIALCLFLPRLGQDAQVEEDERFMAYLEQNGFDISLMGFHTPHRDSKGALAKNGPVDRTSTFEQLDLPILADAPDEKALASVTRLEGSKENEKAD